MIHSGYGLQVAVHKGKIMQTVANAYDPRNLGLLRFLNDAQLFNGIFVNKPDVGMSIKKLHGFLPKKIIRDLKDPGEARAPRIPARLPLRLT